MTYYLYITAIYTCLITILLIQNSILFISKIVDMQSSFLLKSFQCSIPVVRMYQNQIVKTFSAITIYDKHLNPGLVMN